MEIRGHNKTSVLINFLLKSPFFFPNHVVSVKANTSFFSNFQP